MRALLTRGVAGSTLLVAGGYCYARLPRGTWMDRMPVLWSVRAAPHHLAWGLALGAVGLALLTWAWWDLRRGARAGTTDLSGVRRTTAVWAAPLLVAPPLFSGDAWSYVATGALAAQGKSPYLWTPAALPHPLRSGVSPMWRFTPSPYGPLSVAWGGGFAHVIHDPWLLMAAYRLAAVLALVLLAWAVPLLAAKVGRDPVDASVLVIASPFMLAHGIGGMHNDLAMVALVTTALVVTRPGRWLPGALLVGAAAAVKAPGVVGALGVVLLSLHAGSGLRARFTRSAQVGATATGVVLGTGWLTGLGTGWLGALSVPDHEFTVLSLSAVGGRMARSVLHRAGPHGIRLIHEVHPEVFAKQMGIAVLLLAGAWILLRTRLGSPKHAIAAAGVALLLAVVFSPVVHYWYFLWAIPVLACVPLRRAGARALVAAIAMLGLTAVADHALGIRWLWESGAWSLVLVPVAAWAVTAVKDQRSRGSAPHRTSTTGETHFRQGDGPPHDLSRTALDVLPRDAGPVPTAGVSD